MMTATTRRIDRLLNLNQIFLQRLPVVPFPPVREMLAFALRETSVVKDNFGVGTLLGELELHYRVNAWIPVSHAPSLDNTLVRHKLDLSSYDMPAKKGERAAQFP